MFFFVFCVRFQEAQKAEDERKKEEKKKLLEEQRRAVMAGMVSGPAKSGELSFFQKVPEKIKMLEINLSFLQSYMEETKKGHDESFEDASSEVKALFDALHALKTEVQTQSADVAARFKEADARWLVLEAEHKARASMVGALADCSCSRCSLLVLPTCVNCSCLR